MGQVRALVSLRWRMVRDRRSRAGFALLLAAFGVLLTCAVLVGQSMPAGTVLFRLLLLAPTLLAVFAVLALVAPVVAGGGNELFPDGQLVAYPITARTVFLSGVLISPLNLAWITQVVGLMGITAALADRTPLVLLSLLTIAAYVAVVTIGVQVLAWAAVGVRATASGRRLLSGGVAVVGAAVIVTVLSGHTTDVLDRSPTTGVLIGSLAGAGGRHGLWAISTAVLVVVAYACVRLGVRTCDWALRRAVVGRGPELAEVTRRSPRRSPLAELVAVDQASVLRSTALRRGLVVTAVLPGLVALLAELSWPSLALLPGLVAAGAGLLFGVNVFCLDGGGLVWVASLPHNPRTSFVAKLLVIAQTCLGAVAVAVVLAATRADHAPTATEAVALLGSVVTAVLLVVGSCANLSVRYPHKADLRGSRDTPAPPVAMAVYSLRLALVTTSAGLLFAAASASGSVAAALLATGVGLLLSLRSLVRALTKWASVTERVRVVTKVSYG